MNTRPPEDTPASVEANTGICSPRHPQRHRRVAGKPVAKLLGLVWAMAYVLEHAKNVWDAMQGDSTQTVEALNAMETCITEQEDLEELDELKESENSAYQANVSLTMELTAAHNTFYTVWKNWTSQVRNNWCAVLHSEALRVSTVYAVYLAHARVLLQQRGKEQALTEIAFRKYVESELAGFKLSKYNIEDEALLCALDVHCEACNLRQPNKNRNRMG